MEETTKWLALLLLFCPLDPAKSSILQATHESASESKVLEVLGAIALIYWHNLRRTRIYLYLPKRCDQMFE